MPGINPRYYGWQKPGKLAALTTAVLLLAVPALPAQVTPDQAADMVLTSARKAYNEKNYPFAVTRFREFLSRHGSHKNAPAARYGLALALLETPEKNYNEVRDLLQPLAGNKDLPEHASVLYHLGLAQRGLGVQELAQATARPQEAAQRQTVARQRFEEALKQFTAAAAAFAAQAGEVPADVKQLPQPLEWAARARCDQAEMELRTQKIKEARTTSAPFLKDALLTKSRYRDLGRYYHGFASYLVKDYAAAEATLSLLAPFTDPVFGTHARYLLARTHHKGDERAEAALNYEGVLNDYTHHRNLAAEALKHPDKLKNDPAEKERLETLVKDPPPEHIGRASFYWGVLLYEGGRFGDAQTRFAETVKLTPQSPLLVEAQLRLGFCHVQLKQFQEAVKTLEPLLSKEPRHADQVLFWLGKARVGVAPDPGNFQAYEQAVRGALDSFRQAAEKARALGAADPEARDRRGEVLLELGDTLQLIKQYKEAVATYNGILNDKLLPQREEEVGYRLATALHLASEYNESDNICLRFQKAYPRSTLLPAILFRFAENSYFRTLAAEKKNNPPNRPELDKLYDETARRYQEVLTKCPEFPQVSLARYGIALTQYRKGELDKAQQTLESIPDADRGGELGVVSYLLADCLLRLAPTAVPDDALAAGQLEEKLKKAAELLEGFAAAQPNAPELPDALLKLGLCQQRMAALLAQPPERAKALASARAAYEKLLTPPFAKYPGQPQAYLERAKCLAQAGDVNGAVNELRRFHNDPLKASSVAPMALLHLATLLRTQNKAAEAADVLGKARTQYEPSLSTDPARAGWVPLLRYHQGLALRETGKLGEARELFDLILKQAGNSPEAVEAGLRWGQCLKEEGVQKLAAAAKAQAAGKPEQSAAAARLREEGFKALREAVQFLERQAEQVKQKQPTAEARARMMYEIAWACRELAAPEMEAAQAKAVQELIKNLKVDTTKLPPPEVPLGAVPPQPAEQKARAQYQALIEEFPDLPLSSEARFELAELFSLHNEQEPALKLLVETMDKEPAADLLDKVRIRLGAAHAARGNRQAALAQFDAVAQNPKTSQAGQAHYRAGECLIEAKQWAEAVKRLVRFRDDGKFQNLPDLSDRALLRLGHAYAQMGQWDQSRQSLEALVNRFRNSSWIHEARYGLGWAWQQQRQYDQAVNAYSQVTAGTVTETAAKAQLQIGLCRLEQRRYPEASSALLVVPFTYDYPELSAVALLEAARSFKELNQPSQAARLLERVIRDHPQTQWAEAARDRLAILKGS